MADRPNAAVDGGLDADSVTFEVGVTDSRRAMAYLVAPGSDDYIAIMSVLEASVTDMIPAEVAAAVRAAGRPLGDAVVQERLDKLREWTAASARTDPSRIRRYADIRSRNWGWTATPAVRGYPRWGWHSSRSFPTRPTRGRGGLPPLGGLRGSTCLGESGFTR
jgi:hypothetical protein